MNHQQVCDCFHLEPEMLRQFEECGLIYNSDQGTNGIYQDEQIRVLAQLCFLSDVGLSITDIKRFMDLRKTESPPYTRQIHLLRKYRNTLLADIHQKQKLLDRLDFFLHEIQSSEARR